MSDFQAQLAEARARRAQQHGQHVEDERLKAEKQAHEQALLQKYCDIMWRYIQDRRKRPEVLAGERIVRWIRKHDLYRSDVVWANQQELDETQTRPGVSFIRLRGSDGLYAYNLEIIGPKINSMCDGRNDVTRNLELLLQFYPHLHWYAFDQILRQWDKSNSSGIMGIRTIKNIEFRKGMCKDMEMKGMFPY